MKELISVIVPVYKVEKYLNRCVDSILNQTYTNLEVILVDDGSPDSCPAICDEYAKKDKRVKVIHKANGGLSDARNKGLDIAEGKYIAFVDSDDWVEDNYVQNMYNAITDNNADMVICNYQKVDENNVVFEISTLDKAVYNDSNKFDLLFGLNSLPTIVAWNKLYAKHVFDSIRYPYGKINEDEFVVYDVINLCHTIATIPDILHNYFIRQGSIMNTAKPNEKMLHPLEALKDRLNKCKNTKYENLATLQYLYCFVYTYAKVYNDKTLRAKVFSLFKQEYYLTKNLQLKNKLKYLAFRLFPRLIYRLKYKKN